MAILREIPSRNTFTPISYGEWNMWACCGVSSQTAKYRVSGELGRRKHVCHTSYLRGAGAAQRGSRKTIITLLPFSLTNMENQPAQID